MKTIKPQAVIVLLIWCAAAGAADPPEVFGTVGFNKGYLDEPGQLAGGAGLRIPVWNRFAARPEFVMSSDRFYSHGYFLASATYDLRDSKNRSVPYLVGGGGYATKGDQWASYTHGRGTFIGGVGIRLAVGNRLTISPEFRCGNSAFPLITVSFGFRLGGRP